MKIDTIYVEITNRCNLNCATCYNRSGMNRETVEIAPETLEMLIETCRPYGLRRLLFSGGEPTLHSRFGEVLALADRYPDMTFGIVTNGTTKNELLSKYLASRPNMTLQISLDGSCEEVNALTRGPGSFTKTIDFARSVKMPHHQPLLKMVVSQQNLHDVESYYELALSLGFLPEYAFIYKSGNGADGWDDKTVTPRQIMDVTHTIEKLNQKHGTEAFLPQCTSKCPYVTGLEKVSLGIKPDGSIQPCQSLYEGAYTVGNLYTLDMERLEASLESFGELARRRFNTDYGCERCLLRGGCGKGCIAEAVHLHGDPLANDGFCDWRKMQFVERELGIRARLQNRK